MTATFTEDWFCQASQDALAALVERVANVPGLIVEIGAWEGRSTIAMANAATPRVVHTVDTWWGSPGEISSALASQRDVYRQWVENVDAETEGNVYAHRMGWREFIPTLDKPIAFCFIDAEHTYQEVYDNIMAVLPLMPVGAILCGDDAGHPPVRDAVFAALGIEDVYAWQSMWIWEKPADMTLAAEYERLCTTESDIYLHLPRLAAIASKSQHVIELGARSGVSTLAFLYGLELSGGWLTSVDISPQPAIGEHDRWRFIQGDDTDPTVLEQVHGECDVLFIDTSHAYEHTLWELRNWGPKVRNGGLIVCHDTELQRPWDPPCPPTDPDFPVKSAIEVYVAETGYRFVNFPECWGLGIIEVRHA